MAIKRGYFWALAAMALLLGAFGYWSYSLAPLEQSQPELQVTIERGSGLRAIAAQLRAQGVEVSEPLFWLAARMRGDAGRLKAGTYQVKAPGTMRELLDRMVRGDVLLAQLRFIEGWTFAQMRAAVDQQPDLRHDTAGISESELLSRIGAVEKRAEGLFLPDTYHFAAGTSDLEIFRHAYRELQQELAAAWETRSAPLPYADQYQALIMASIVEKETGLDAERPKVAAVFVNRLRRGMALQSDPTTIYGLGAKFDGNLRKTDLLTDTPYNTYTRSGLTPTPIALPGRASIRAALNPAPIAALYFVSRGDGSSEFSDDLATHNRAVSRYQLKRR